MLSARTSLDASRNPEVRVQKRKKREGNAAWIARALQSEAINGVAVVLVGGTRPAEFASRVAQRHVRSDSLPSFWSDAAIALPAPEAEAGFELVSAGWLPPLELLQGATAHNAIDGVPLDRIDDPALMPNVALLHFSGASEDVARAAVARLRKGRLAVDLVTPLARWLAYGWGARGQANPLLEGVPMPSAHFAESVMAQLDIDLMPGLDERTSCPEAIWQAALWWAAYYEGDPSDAQHAPRGLYVVDQPAAAVLS